MLVKSSSINMRHVVIAYITALFLHMLVFLFLKNTQNQVIIEDAPFRALHIRLTGPKLAAPAGAQPGQAAAAAAMLPAPATSTPAEEEGQKQKASKASLAVAAQTEVLATPSKEASPTKDSQLPQEKQVAPRPAQRASHAARQQKAKGHIAENIANKETPATQKSSQASSKASAKEAAEAGNGDDGDASGILGNSIAEDAKQLERYTQLISLWVQKHQAYPEEAKKMRIQGSAQVAIEIDHAGNILSYQLLGSTGDTVLDRAVIDTINAANPVPPIDKSFEPQTASFGFTIRLNFTLE